MSDGTAVGVTMELREEPRFVQFATGEIVEGVLLGMERIAIKDKQGVRYTVREDGGELVSFLGTWQINTKLRIGDRGHRVSLKCVGEDVMVKRGDNCMKVFEVMVSKEKVLATAGAAGSSVEITEDDIPF